VDWGTDRWIFRLAEKLLVGNRKLFCDDVSEPFVGRETPPQHSAHTQVVHTRSHEWNDRARGEPGQPAGGEPGGGLFPPMRSRPWNPACGVCFLLLLPSPWSCRTNPSLFFFCVFVFFRFVVSERSLQWCFTTVCLIDAHVMCFVSLVGVLVFVLRGSALFSFFFLPSVGEFFLVLTSHHIHPAYPPTEAGPMRVALRSWILRPSILSRQVFFFSFSLRLFLFLRLMLYLPLAATLPLHYALCFFFLLLLNQAHVSTTNPTHPSIRHPTSNPRSPDMANSTS
jgi:hypothetical protein